MNGKRFLAALVIAATPAAAHDWYPMECCSGMDCAPVEKVEILQAPAIASFLPTQAQAPAVGGMLVTTKHGSVVVPANFPRRESKDGRMHACMRPMTYKGWRPGQSLEMRLICIFMPPAM